MVEFDRAWHSDKFAPESDRSPGCARPRVWTVPVRAIFIVEEFTPRSKFPRVPVIDEVSGQLLPGLCFFLDSFGHDPAEFRAQT
jgi:hypothetical protein